MGRRVLSALDDHTLKSSNPTSRQVKRSKNERYTLKSACRSIKTTTCTENPEPVETPPDWAPNGDVEGWELAEQLELEDEDIDIVSAVKRRYQCSDDPMKEWMPWRGEFLQEMLRWEAQTSDGRLDICVSCVRRKLATKQVARHDEELGAPPSADTEDEGELGAEEAEGGDEAIGTMKTGAPLYRCQECASGVNECQECCLERHKDLPLHQIEMWIGECYERLTLKSLGLRVQLGHNGLPCPAPEPGPQSFTVLHVNGIHLVNVDYCNCERRVHRPHQLLRAGWYPATAKYPATCATIDLLKHFHGLSLCSKVSAHEYYLNLERLTNNSRIDIPKTRYRAFLRMIRQWRHLRMLKRAGRGHIVDGIKSIGPGDLAVLCAACPIKDVNLPDKWEEVAPSLKFLYMLFVSIDANFRLKNRLRKTENHDPGLHTGLAYFVAPTSYKNHVLKHATEAEISTCSSFHAMSHADSKSTAGLRSTGVGMCVCARHEMVRPLGVGDLQKGERYCNMDFVLLSALYGIALLRIMIIYDIACQWKVNFPMRMSAFPQDMQLPTSCKLDFAVPKCHAPAHKASCQTPHSLNLKPGAGQTDGEGIERDWSAINLAANSTREMGEGSRHDTLDDLFAYHNWQKTTGLGHTLKRKYLVAVLESRRHKELHDEFSQSVSPELLAEWTRMITQWEGDHSKPNPYQTESIHETEADVKRQLLALKCREVASLSGARDSPETVFLTTGLMIEENQRRLQLEVADRHLTSIQDVQLQEKRLHISRQIKSFRKSQLSHIPTLNDIIVNATVDPPNAELIPLHLPSSLSAQAQATQCSPTLIAKETKLRVAQCHDTLERIRLTQRSKRHLVIYKRKDASGQRNGTRTANHFDRLEVKIKQAVLKYRNARSALVGLLGEDAVPPDLRPLKDDDIRPPPAFDIDKALPKNIREAAAQLGQGHYELPWIWRSAAAFAELNNDEELNIGMRVEWSKSRARCLRWNEEVLLVKEEMRRVRVTLQHRANWWKEQAQPPHGTIPPNDASIAQGISAYAHRQSLVNSRLRDSFTRLWEKPPSKRSHLVPATMPDLEQSATAADETLMSELLAEVEVAEDGLGGEDEDDAMDNDEGSRMDADDDDDDDL